MSLISSSAVRHLGYTRSPAHDLPPVYENTNQLLAAIVESSEDAIIGEDLNGIITSWNRGAEYIFGFTTEEAIGRPVSLLHLPEDETEMQSILDMVRRGERASHFETVRRRKDGSKVLVSLSVSPILDDEGIVIGASKIARDITSRRRAEEVLHKAEKLAVASRLAASVAHEINNPLAALTNLHFLLKGEDLPEQARHYLEMADHELSRITHITTQALGFYRENKAAAPTSMREVLESALTIHKQRFETNGVRLIAQYQPVPEISCHTGEIRQVFVNLIGNALDAMPSGGDLLLRVHPGVHWKTQARGIRAIVADTGPGLTEEVRQKLFEPFYTTKGVTRTGLGLWMCEQIINRHRGYLAVRSRTSKPGRGTVFSLFLPLERAERTGF